MKIDRSKDNVELLGEHLRDRKPSPEEEQAVLDHVWKGLRSERDRVPQKVLRDFGPARTAPLGGRLLWVGVAAVLVLAIVLSGVIMRSASPAVVERVDGTLERVNKAGSLPILAGEKLVFGDVVRSLSGTSAVLTLSDGSEIEMRANSELALERADDGLRIHLNDGGVLVSAAKQRSGHLYVQTKDVTVSVVGTVFLVSAEGAGSRVAVFQGEVQVLQGTTSKTLLPGEQVASNPLMQSHPVVEQVAWSRGAEAHVALLQQPKRLEFETASIRPGDSVLGTFVTRPRCKGIDGELNPPLASAPAVPLGRCVGANVPEILLIATAYDVDLRRVSGLPGPLEQATYQIEAKAENPASTTRDELRQMLQNLLAERFKLKVHRETKETEGYVVLVGKDGVKFKEASGDEEAFQLRGQLPPPGVGQPATATAKGNFSLRRMFDGFSILLGPMVDRTNLPGVYEINLTLHSVFNPPSATDAGARGGSTLAPPIEYDPPLPKAIEEQLGLHLERGKVPLEYLVVDHIEKATEN